MIWFSFNWWKFLLGKPAEGVSHLTAFWCRATNHKCGVIFYNPHGLEPDMHCKNCYDDLG